MELSITVQLDMASVTRWAIVNQPPCHVIENNEDLSLSPVTKHPFNNVFVN